MMFTVDSIAGSVGIYRPRKFIWRRWVVRSAVTAILSLRNGSGEASVLLMKRATRPGDPWSGHMSFPGGRQEPEDAHVFETAVRETWEETGLQLKSEGSYMGRLSDIIARPTLSLRRRPMIVTPFVFHLEQEPVWQLDPNEVDELVWVPLRFLANTENRETMQWERGKVKLTLPCYFYEGHRIWGLTLRMLDELIKVAGA